MRTVVVLSGKPVDARSAASARMESLVRHLPSMGWQVTAVEPSTSGVLRSLGGVRGLGRVVQWLLPLTIEDLSVCVSLLMRSRRASKFSVVIASTPSFGAALAGAALASRRRVPLILDYRDPWASSLYSPYGDRWRRTRRRIEHSVRRRASAATFVSAERLRDDLSTHEDLLRREVVPNGIEWSETVEAVERVPVPLRLVHAGNVYGPRLDRFREVLAELDRVLTDHGHAWELLHLGASLSRSVTHQSIRWLPTVARGAMSTELANCDVGIVVVGGDDVPTKAFDYWAAGLPILVHPEGVHNWLPSGAVAITTDALASPEEVLRSKRRALQARREAAGADAHSRSVGLASLGALLTEVTCP